MTQQIKEKTPLKVLYLEDSPQDVEIIRELLLGAGYDLNMECTDAKKDFTSLLRKNQYDIILSDFKLPGFDAFGALELHNEICPDVPFICVSGSIGEEIAIELIMKGAVDYVLKDRLVRLPTAIKRVLNEVREKNLLARVEEELQENQKRFLIIFNASPIGTTITQMSDGKIIEANPAFTTMLGYPHDEIIGRTTLELNAWIDISQREKMLKILHEKGSVHDFETNGRRKSGENIDLLVSAEIIELSGTKYLLSLFYDITERKRMEEALQNSESKYRMLYNQMTTGLAVHEIILDDKGQPVDYRFLQVNPAFEKFTGLRAEAVLGKTILEVLPNTEQSFIKRYGEVALSGKDIQFESFSRELKKYFNIRAYSPEQNKFATIFEDITERKRTEEELKNSEEKYRSIFENVQDVYYEASIEGTILDVSPSIEAISKGQYHRDDLIGKSMYDFYVINDGRQALLALLKERGNVTDYEILLKNRDGSYVPCSIASKIQFDVHGKPLKIVGSMHDITVRKLTAEALKASESFLNSVIDQSPYPMWISDDKGVLIRINNACLDLLNIKEDEVMGKYNVLNDNIVAQQGFLPLVSRVFEKGETAHFEIKYDTSKLNNLKIEQKVSVILDTTIFPIKNINGIITNAVIQHLDITQRKQMEEQMRQMQKLEGLGTLAGGIAHDFNNILGIILAYNTGIKRFKEDPKKMDLATETITKAVDRGKTLVQQILTFARKTETAFGAVNVNDIVMEVMTMILETFPKTLTYAQNFEKGMPYINADRTQIYQTLLNLCVNARDAMPNGGMLTINTCIVTCADLRHKHPDVSDNNYICIEVSDTGEGMTDDVKKRIFEPFFTTKGIGKGTGLGLSVVFGVVQNHKGFVDVESEVGKGTTFKLFLPALKAAETLGEKEEEETLEEIPGGTETLLVVEDEEMLMMSLQMVLVEKGYNVIPAKDGLEALKIYQENKNDIALVLTDLGLPTITGLDVCQRIKAIKSNERVVLATGYLDPEMKTELLKTGIKHFLYKPYDLKRVLKVVRETLDGK
jgi:PAS domain S-box-containing protein